MRKLFQNFIKCGILGWVPGNFIHCSERPAQKGLYPAGRHLSVDVSHLRSRLSSYAFFPSARRLHWAVRAVFMPHSSLLPNMCPEACSGKRISVPGTMKGPLEREPSHTAGLFPLLGRHRPFDGTCNEGRRTRPPTLKPRPPLRMSHPRMARQLFCAAACSCAASLSRSIFFMVNR